jgi:hypothetical protein
MAGLVSDRRPLLIAAIITLYWDGMDDFVDHLTHDAHLSHWEFSTYTCVLVGSTLKDIWRIVNVSVVGAARR